MNDSVKLKVLVIDDDRMAQKIFSKQLGSLNHSYDLADTAEDGYELLKENCYHAILLNVTLPKMDGVELTKLIRSSDEIRNKEIPIVCISNTDDQGSIDKFLEVGMNFFLGKDYDINLLDDVLNRYNLCDR